METFYVKKKYIDGNLIPKLRAVLLGNSEVGKTSLIMRYLNCNYREEYFPTKELVLYKNLVNLNPASDDLNDFVYMEFLDTIAFDRGNSISDYMTFFDHISRNDIQISSTNVKLGRIGDTMKYEFFHFKKPKKRKKSEDKVVEEEPKIEISKTRLFSYNNIMAHIFVFDYNDDKSIDDINSLCRNIIENEINQNENSEFNTIKVFIANKYPYLLEDQMFEVDEISKKIIYPIYERDERANNILQMLKVHFRKHEVAGIKRTAEEKADLKRIMDENAKQNIFFVNTKYNIGVENAFVKIFEKILHKENLWQVVNYASSEEDSDEADEESSRGILNSIFCCGGREKIDTKKKDIKNTKEKNFEDKNITEKNVVITLEEDLQIMDPFKFMDEDEDYDQNVNIKPKSIYIDFESKNNPLVTKLEEEIKNKKKCIIF